jgi:hypothetical protein
MSKQDIATARWETARRMEKIDGLMADAKNYSFPAGQMQAGLQLANVEVPWLLNYIEELQHGRTEESAPQLEALA